MILNIISNLVKGQFILLPIALLLATYPHTGHAFNPCGSVNNPYGPFDYTDPVDQSKRLPVVEQYHFYPAVRDLTERPLSQLVGGLDYTLRAFPNHHRALFLVAKLERRLGGQLAQPPRNKHGQSWPASAECYFDRALRFRPKDPTVHLIFGIHLHLTGKLDQALKAYKISEQIAPNSADLHYNLGLLYFERKEYAAAKQHAQKAYKLGHPLPGLRNKLATIDQWP